jgi:Tfp pilus assembly protein PilF
MPKTIKPTMKQQKINTANVSMTIEVAMGYIEMGQYKKALEHLEVAQRLLTPELSIKNQL